MLTILSNEYNPTLKADDPEVTVKIPCNILRDLVARSEENGNTVEVELAIRLARSLERDLEMIAIDNNIAKEAFEKIEGDPVLAQQIFDHLTQEQ